MEQEVQFFSVHGADFGSRKGRKQPLFVERRHAEHLINAIGWCECCGPENFVETLDVNDIDPNVHDVEAFLKEYPEHTEVVRQVRRVAFLRELHALLQKYDAKIQDGPSCTVQAWLDNGTNPIYDFQEFSTTTISDRLNGEVEAQ